MSAIEYLVRDAWQPVTLPYGSAVGARSPEATARIVDSADLLHPRYLRDSAGQTKCNIFVWDISRAHGCEVAHLQLFPGRQLDVDMIRRLQAAGLTQDAVDQLTAPRWRELDANQQVLWLAGPQATRAGWRECDAAEARRRGDGGYPTVAGWFHPGGIGHVAWVIDTPPGDVEPNIAQAGAANVRRCRVRETFGNHPVQFWTHE